MSIELKAVMAQVQQKELAELASIIWNEYYVSLLSQKQIDYMLEQFQSVQAIREQIKQGYQYYFIEHEGSAMGYAAVKQEQKSLFLSKLYVKKEWRGQGYGKAALQLITEMAAKRKLQSIWLTVNRYNASSITVYERFGFSIIDEQVADIGSGYVMDDFIMELKIS